MQTVTDTAVTATARAQALDGARKLRARSLRAEASGRYRFSETATHTDLYGTCYAVLLRALVRDRIGEDERAAFVSALHSWQDARTGLFADPNLPAQDTAERSWSFLHIEMTHLCLAALRELEEEPRHPLRALSLIGRSPDGVRHWMSQVQWWLLWPPPPAPDSKLRDLADWTGHELLHFGGALMQAAERGDASWDSVDTMLSELETMVDPVTGLWGTQHRCARDLAVMGSAALARLFLYRGHPSPSSVNLGEAAALQVDATMRGLWMQCVRYGLTNQTDWSLRGRSALTCWAP